MCSARSEDSSQLKESGVSPVEHLRTGLSVQALIPSSCENKQALTQDSRTIKIRDELYSKLEELLGESGASSVDELAARVLRDWLTKEASSSTSKARVSKLDEKIVEDRLKALGYI